jgi:hypothetical protein
MIFAHTLDKVLANEKWQTRRLAKQNERLCAEKDMFGERVFIRDTNNRRLYEVGKSYAVQPNRGKKAVARIVIKAIRREPVRAIDEQDARAEGFTTREEFLTAWRTIHGSKSNLNRIVWVIEFELQCTASDDFRMPHGQRLPIDTSSNHSHDISAAFAKSPRTGMHSGDNRFDGVGQALPDRLPL